MAASESRVRESITRSFFALLYDHIGFLALWSWLRSLPWLALALLFSFLPTERLGTTALLNILSSAALIAILVGPALTGEVYRRAAALSRGDSMPDGRRRYRLLLAWSLIQFALAYLLLLNVTLLRSDEPSAGRFPLMLAAGVSFWLWLVARLWSLYFIPLLVARGEALRPTLGLTLRLFLASPRRLFAHALQRQLFGLLLCVSGLGLIFGLGALLPLQACLAARIALRPLGLDLAPAEGPQSNLPLPEGPGLRKLWRPWE
jgi:hypothetical protein